MSMDIQDQNAQRALAWLKGDMDRAKTFDAPPIVIEGEIPYYYNTTLGAWHSIAEYPAFLTPPTALATASGYSTYNATSTTIYVPFRTSPLVYFTRCEVTSRVNGTNNATNFWTIAIQHTAVNAASANTMISIPTSGDTAGTYTDHAANIAANNAPVSTKRYVRMVVTPTLAPGTLDVFGTIFYRLVRP